MTRPVDRVYGTMVRGRVILLGLAALAALCGCGRSDETIGTAALVRREWAAGRQAVGDLRREERETELRTMRVLAKRLVSDGKTAEARRVTAAIVELQRELDRPCR